MNMRKFSENYAFMLETFNAKDGPLEVSPAMRTTCYDKHGRLFRDDVIDFVFYKGNGLEPVDTIRRVPCFTGEWGRRGETWLSDHPPMEIELTFPNP